MLLKKDSIDYILILILAATAFLYIKGIGSYPFWDPWEAKYGQAMREMEQRNDYITPYFKDKIRWTKPILIYWAMAVPMWVGGNNELTARLPSAIGALLGVWFIYWFLKKLRGRSTAIVGACILATTPQYFYMARQAMPDMLFSVFLLAAMGYFALAQFGNENKRKFLWLFYLSVGLAVLTKGPLGAVIVLGALTLFTVIHITSERLFSIRALFNDIRYLVSEYHIISGFTILFLVAAPWYITIFIKHGSSFVDNFVMYENIQRFQEPIRGHHGNGYFYIKTILHGMYPWSGFFPLALAFYFYGDNDKSEALRQKWYYLSWFLAIFSIFAIAGTKQDHYILPITPAFAVIVALFWEQYLKPKPPFWIFPALLVSVVFLCMPIRDFLIESNKYIFDNFTIKRSIKDENVNIFLMWFLGAWVVILIAAFLARLRKLVVVLALITSYANGIYFCHYIVPEHAQRRSLFHYIDYYQQHKMPESKMIFYGKIRYSINYYLGTQNYKYFSKSRYKKLARHVKDHENVYIIAQKSYTNRLLTQLKKQSKFKWNYVLTNHPKYYLISNAGKF